MLDNSITHKFRIQTGKQKITAFLEFSVIIINYVLSYVNAHNEIFIIVQYQCLVDSGCRQVRIQ